MTQSNVIHPPRFADATAGIRHVFLRDLLIDARIGVYPHEQEAPQRVRINIDLSVGEGAPIDDRIENVVSYEDIVTGVREVVAAGHVNLVETLAENIAALCLEDRRVRAVRVRVEKLDIVAEAASVGVEIERVNPHP